MFTTQEVELFGLAVCFVSFFIEQYFKRLAYQQLGV